MDTSEQYIKMCEQAEEIQGLWIPQIQRNGDYILQKNWRELAHTGLMIPRILHFCNDTILIDFNGDKFIWLPRQDQLQEMVSYKLWALNHKFTWWLYDSYNEENSNVRTTYSISVIDGHIKHQHEGLKSMEQLWLAFVMKEKYNKVWDGEDWRIE